MLFRPINVNAESADRERASEDIFVHNQEIGSNPPRGAGLQIRLDDRKNQLCITQSSRLPDNAIIEMISYVEPSHVKTNPFRLTFSSEAPNQKREFGPHPSVHSIDWP